jgi:hypothetical protein
MIQDLFYLGAGANVHKYAIDTDMTSRANAASLCAQSTVQCLRCDCAARLCFVALKKKSLNKKKQHAEGIKCPVHDKQSSEHVQEFFSLIQVLSQGVKIRGIVWDWCDVPQDHHMHVDATVFCESTHTRFEIDGENHFFDCATARIDTDALKDEYIRACGAGMVRLHFFETSTVGQLRDCIESALGTPPASVEYTNSYTECLDEHEKENSAGCKKRKLG